MFAVNEKNYDKAFTYVTDQAKTNPVEKQKWMEAMMSAPKVVVGSLGTSRISRINGMKRIHGEWHIEGFYKNMPDDK